MWLIMRNKTVFSKQREQNNHTCSLVLNQERQKPSSSHMVVKELDLVVQSGPPSAKQAFFNMIKRSWMRYAIEIAVFYISVDWP